MKRNIALFMVGLLVASLACEVQVNLTDEPPRPSPLAPIPTRAGAPSATRQIATTAASSATFRPTNTPMHLVFTPPVTRTTTNTATPPLPDFPDVLTFGGGGGGGNDCEAAGFPPGPYGVSNVGAHAGWAGIFCTTIWRPRDGVIRLELISPAGPILDSPNLTYNPSRGSMEWEGYPGFEEPAERSSDGTLYSQILVWWPISWTLGQWRAHVYGGEGTADLLFWVAKEGGRPYLMARDERTDRALAPAAGTPFMHPLRPNVDGTVDVVGIDYPPNTQVFLLLYRNDSALLQASMVHKQAVLSDEYGQVRARLQGPLEVGAEYMLFGLTDPNTPLGGGVGGCGNFPCDMFVVMR